VALGHDDGTEQVLLRFSRPAHAPSPISRLAMSVGPSAVPRHAAELVVIVKTVMLSNSCNVLRTAVYKLSQDLRRVS
jgi:hypothetical protein